MNSISFKRTRGRQGARFGCIWSRIFSEHNSGQRFTRIICNDRATLIYLAEEPGIHRSKSLDEPRRLARQSGFRGDRSGSYRGLPVLTNHCGGRAIGEADDVDSIGAGRVSLTTDQATGCMSTFRLEPYLVQFRAGKPNVRGVGCPFWSSIRIQVYSLRHVLVSRNVRRRRFISIARRFRASRPSLRPMFCAPILALRSRHRSSGPKVKAGLDPSQFNIHNAMDRALQPHGRSFRGGAHGRSSLSRLWRRWQRIALH